MENLQITLNGLNFHVYYFLYFIIYMYIRKEILSDLNGETAWA